MSERSSLWISANEKISVGNGSEVNWISVVVFNLVELWSECLWVGNSNGVWVATIEELMTEVLIGVPVLLHNIFEDHELLTLGLEWVQELIFVLD